MRKKLLSTVLCLSIVLGSCSIPAHKAEAAGSKITVTNAKYGMLTIKKGKTVKLKINGNKKAVFTSSNKKIASVTSKGVVKGKKNGTCKVTVSLKKSKKIKKVIKITIGTPVKKMSIVDGSSVSVSAGDTYKVTTSVAPLNASNKKIAYVSSNKKVATVSSDGTIKGVSNGTAVITAIAKDGSNKKSKCTVTVTGGSSAKVNMADLLNGADEDKTEVSAEEKANVTNVATEQKNVKELEINNLDIGYASGDCADVVTDDVKLASEGIYGSAVKWTSSDENVISAATGRVNRSESENKKVTLTAKISDATKNFELTVMKKKMVIPTEVNKTVKEIANSNNTSVKDLDIRYNDAGYIESIGEKISDVTVTDASDAKTALKSVESALGLNDINTELQQENAVKDEYNSTYTFKQKYNGYDVYGANVRLTVNADGVTDYLVSSAVNFEDDAKLNEIDVLAEDNLKKKINSSDFTVRSVEGQKYVYEEDGVPKLAYVVYADGKQTGEDEMESIPETYKLVVDASTGEVVNATLTSYSLDDTQNKLKTAVKNGQVSDIVLEGLDSVGNTRKIRAAVYNDGTASKPTYYYIMKDLLRDITMYRGNGDANNLVYPGKIVWKSSADKISKEQISAMANVKQAYAYFDEKWNYKSYDGKGSSIGIQIGTGIKNNMSWNGEVSTIFVGKGVEGSNYKKNISLAGALDVVSHEFGHGVIASMTDLEDIYFGTTGSINEAYADLLGLFSEAYWKKGDIDWTLGESITKSGCVRSMADPEKYNKPSKIGGKYFVDYKKNDWKNYKKNDRCGVHVNSTVITHAAYLMSKHGFNNNGIEKIWYKSLQLGYTSHSDFYDVRRNVLQAASLLGVGADGIESLKRVFDEVGITKKNCEMPESYFAKLEVANKKSATAGNNATEDEYQVTLDVRKTVYLAKTFNNASFTNATVNVYSFNSETGEISSKPIASGLEGYTKGCYVAKIPDVNEFVVEVTGQNCSTTRYYRKNVGSFIKKATCDTIFITPTGLNGTTEGIVEDAETRVPIANAPITFFEGQENYGYTEAVANTVSGTDGSYSITMKPGIYTGCVEVNGYYKEYFFVRVMPEKTLQNYNCYPVQQLNDNSYVIKSTYKSNKSTATLHKFHILGKSREVMSVKLGEFFAIVRCQPDDNNKIQIYSENVKDEFMTCTISPVVSVYGGKEEVNFSGISSTTTYVSTTVSSKEMGYLHIGTILASTGNVKYIRKSKKLPQ